MLVIDALLCEGKESIANHLETVFMQNVQLLLTSSKKMQEIAWICPYCAQKCTNDATLEFRLFQMFVHNIVCTVKGNTLQYLQHASSLHKNLQFTLEKHDGKGNLTFLDLNINENDKRK